MLQAVEAYAYFNPSNNIALQNNSDAVESHLNNFKLSKIIYSLDFLIETLIKILGFLRFSTLQTVICNQGQETLNLQI